MTFLTVIIVCKLLACKCVIYCISVHIRKSYCLDSSLNSFVIDWRVRKAFELMDAINFMNVRSVQIYQKPS